MKYVSIAKYALLGISAVVIALFLALGDFDKLTGVDDSWLTLMMNWTYIMVGLASVLAIIFPIFHMVQNPKGALQSLMGLAIVAVVIAIAYAFSEDTPIKTAVELYDNPASLKLSDTGLFTTYAALGVAILAVVIGEIVNAFK